ncbi:transmembrane protein 60-like [Pimephales promelas]|uniref:transmembrane protein 60-like n=1 Tax=Pimephales promelas TaxID=90988 RepID=UPI0019554B8D|nr:transmembrane protein 60-like [Pimephales promelas]XP_039516531.1 transmembrane protein 60-like [Pimephales promelas]XP_039516532.1 transmembrane protein 60-like [Pimephales promelas]XP_039516533.1 transmembrane protein 60-like [Pimephales promelas]XP_039516534.1 transmembrane protein 60-like [Pimephales promelas]XP_039516535.1 transmembrane protein 60-like [Pimephales promelas]XP_039516536.1 transmembrane protein 60-like [Pimephales promelas]XP_039516537.1 transmembrane protein 60-like [
MSLAQRVLLTWIFSLVFLILLVLKLDGKVKWNWFLIFLPVWVLDGLLLLLLGVKVAGRCRAGFDPRLKVWYLLALMMKLGFCVTLCARLEHIIILRPLFICVPLWGLLTGALIQLGLHMRSD